MIEKKRLLFVIESLQCGGSEKSIVSLLSMLDRDRFEVDLLLLSHKGILLPLVPKWVTILPEPVEMAMLREPLLVAFNKALIDVSRFRIFLWRILGSIAIRRGTRIPQQSYWIFLAKILPNQETTYDMAIGYAQGIATYYIVDKVKAVKKLAWVNTDYRKQGFNRYFDRPYYAKIDRIVAVSHACQDALALSFPEFTDKIEVMYDIISKELTRQLAANGEGFTDDFDGARIVTVGRLVEEKGYDLAIAACARLKEMGHRLRWYAIGEGYLRRTLEGLIAHHGLQYDFILLGEKANPFPYMAQAAVYVQTSRLEGFCMSITEARILGIPIVTTNFPSAYNQIVDGRTGLIAGMDAAEIANAVSRLLTDRQCLEAIRDTLRNKDAGSEAEVANFYSIIDKV